MLQDHLGNPLTGPSEALAGIDDFVDGFLAYRPKAVNVLTAAENNPGSVMANVYAGFLWMFLERPEAPEKARPFLQAASRELDRANDREKLHVAMLDAWISGDIPKVVAVADAITTDYPHDLACVKVAQAHYIGLGDSPGILRSAAKMVPDNAGNAHLHAMAAFGYEQCHLLDDARRAAECAIAIDESEPWAHHAIAHVLLTRGRTEEGLSFMNSMTQHWDGLNSFMFTHNWWHLALFRISQGREDEALRIFDERCWGIEPDYSQDQIGAVSLLARLEFCGLDAASRWAMLRPHLETRADDADQAFLTIQYLYGLARAGSPKAADLLDTIRLRAADAPAWSRDMWQKVALPACEGVYAHATGRHGDAVDLLSSVMPRLWQIGGSHAQRDLFEQILLDAMVRDGRWIAAQQLLENRRGFDPDGVPLNRLLAKVYGKLGLPGQARDALLRAGVAQPS